MSDLIKQELPQVRFLTKVKDQYLQSTNSEISFNETEKQLACNLFLKLNHSLKTLENKRNTKKNSLPYVWENINLEKLFIDSANKIKLKLDALTENNIHPVAFRDKHNKNKYTLELMIGYAGKEQLKKSFSLYELVGITYELVYEKDKFVPIKRSLQNPESYDFKIDSPFDRGEVIGGFGYINYKDTMLNKLVLIPMKTFKKLKDKAIDKTFWNNSFEEMCLKTVVHRTTSQIPIDPLKVFNLGEAYFDISDSEDNYLKENKEDIAKDEINDNANKDIFPIEINGTVTEKVTVESEIIDNIDKETLEGSEIDELDF